jgi:hypothetical protein
MVGNPATDTDADRSDLRIADPYPWRTGSPVSPDTETLAHPDENRLEGAHIARDIPTEEPKIDDRIGDQLPRTVKGHAASAPDADSLEAEAGMGASEVRFVSSAPKRIDGLMLEDEQIVVDVAGELSIKERFLES